MAMAWSRRAAPLLVRAARNYHHGALRVLVGSSPINPAQLNHFPSDAAFRPASNNLVSTNMWSGVRRMSSDISVVPKLSDPASDEALNALLATTWAKIHKEIKDGVEGALAKSGDGTLSTVWSSAQAVEKFADTLLYLRMELDELNGSSGETVRRMPDGLLKALDSAFNKYQAYLASFSEDEDFLKKKVQNELGGILLQIKQRCSGLGPEWGKIALLGTSGLSGSYIERRA
ncbi:hypothetical protein MPTK2_1g15670 [Marchantia polymorpha subsp. ruderalis]